VRERDGEVLHHVSPDVSDSSMAAEPVPPNCEVCKEDHLATFRCVDCAENMCEALAGTHLRQKATRNHNVLTLEAFNTHPQPSVNCLEHNQAFAFYDTQCQNVVCRDCVALEHSGHKCISLSAAGVGCREKLQELAQKATALSNKMHDVEASVARVRQDLTLCHQQEDAKITNAFNQIRAALSNREALLHAELAQVYTNKSFVLDNQLDLLRSHITRLSSVSTRANEAVARGGDVALLLARSEVTTTFTALETQPSQPPKLTKEDALLTFTVNTNRALSLIPSMGKINSNSTFASTTTAEGLGLSSARVGQTGTFTITARDQQGALRGVGGDVFQVEVTGELPAEHKDDNRVRISDCGNGTHVVTYSVPPHASGENLIVSVLLHGSNICKSPFTVRLSRGCLGTFVRTWGTYGSANGHFRYPTGVAVCPAGKVFVCDETNRVQVFGTNGNFIRNWGNSMTFHIPRAIAISPRGEVLVCEDHRVLVFSTSGAFLRTWGCAGSLTGQFVNARGISVSLAGEVFVCEQNNHRVQVFDANGTFLRTWGSNGNASGFFSNPRGIVVSPTNEVFVCDHGNRRVQVFDTNGTFIRAMECIQPLAVAISPAGEIIVCDGTSRIQVFDADGSFVRTWGSDGSGNDQFSSPWSVAVSLSGEIFVCDTGNNRIQVFK